jgi:hypothetical protein
MQIPKKIIPDSDVKKWTDLGWVFSGSRHSRDTIRLWFGSETTSRESRPHEIHQVDQQADGSFA